MNRASNWLDAIVLGVIVIIAVAIVGFALFLTVAQDVIHSATLPDEDQAQCESLGGRWSVNHQCYNAGEPTTIKKLKENLRSMAR